MNFYEIILNDSKSKIYILEIDGIMSKKSKRYYLLANNEVSLDYSLTRINSIGTLMEYFDKNEIELREIEEPLEMSYISDLFRYATDKFSWIEKYELARKYYNKFEGLSMPIYFKTSDGVNYSSTGINLGLWLMVQKEMFLTKETNPEVRELINNSIETILLLDDFTDWDKYFGLAQNYYNKYHNLEIPINFLTLDGENFNIKGYNLGMWANIQRQTYMGKSSTPLTEEQISKLESIGMLFTMKEKLGMYFNLIKKYYEFNNNLKIPFEFRTTDGVHEDENGYTLGMWFFLNKINDYFANNKVTKDFILDKNDYLILNEIDSFNKSEEKGAAL